VIFNIVYFGEVMEKPIKYVKASITNSCVPACLAMVTGKTLNRVIKDIYEHWENEGRYQGLDDDIIDQYLSKNGYAVQRIGHEYEPNKLLIPKWPIKPFAPVHIVDVWSTNPPGMHAVVMLKDGTVYDPSNRRIKDISMYQRIFAITGIWKVTDKVFDVK
jgi:hypothetical protein